MTLKRENNYFSVISVPKLVKNEVLHQILGLLFKNLKIQDGHRRPFWIYANIKKYVPLIRVTPSIFLTAKTYTIRKSKVILREKHAHESVAGSQTKRLL